ncbi:hypothetical protein AC1031_020711 [Aphanomyces cochlioides]|nr:hypothetical protein AC1031_020711 [Aphanomyces cochlioides]
MRATPSRAIVFPENATHLVQPLDICVFAQFKRAIRDGIFDFMIDNDEASTIPRSEALEIASKAWKRHISAANMVSGFEESGIWPLSQDQMHARLERYASGGVPSSFEWPEWLAAQSHIRRHVLTLPDESKKPPRRKKIRVGGRILTLALLRELATSKRPKKGVSDDASDVVPARDD